MASNYDASSIKTMSSVTHIREFPSMYIPSPASPKAQYHIIKEVVDNSFDEAENMSAVEHHIKLIFYVNKDMTKYQVCVIDDGRGTPIERLTECFSEPRTSGKWGSAYSSSTGVFGVGAKATSILSKKFVAISKRDSQIGVVDIEKGIVTYEGRSSDESGDNTTGTVVFFEPDPTIFVGIDKFITSNGYKNVMLLMQFMAAYTVNTNTSVILAHSLMAYKFITECEEAKDYEKLWNAFHKHTGDVLLTGSYVQPIDFLKQTYGLKGNIAMELNVAKPVTKASRLSYSICLVFMEDRKYTGGIVSMVNKTLIPGTNASQNIGLRTQLKAVIGQFITDGDIRSYFDATYSIPVYGSLNIKWDKAKFTGQTKDDFEDEEFYAEYVDALKKDFDQKPSEFWLSIYDLLKESIETSYHEFINKGLRGGKTKDIDAQLNKWSSFLGCSSTDSDKTELLIVEGDSAGGAIDEVRNSTYQAVFLLKGKPVNTERHPLSYVNKDLVFQDFARVIGVMPGDKDLSNMRFNKIGILTDADDDGYHIRTLVIDILKTLSPEILSQGHVFVSNPPLYYMRLTRGSMRAAVGNMQGQLFIRDHASMVGVKIDRIYRNTIDLDISVNNGPIVRLEGDDYKLFCYRVIEICDIIKNVAAVLAIDPELLEMLVHCLKYLTAKTVDTEAIRRILLLDKVEYKAKENTLILSKGIVDKPVSLTNLVFDIKTYIIPQFMNVFAGFSWWDISVYMTTKNTDIFDKEPISLMYLYKEMNELDSIINVSRFKGLGQMPASVLEMTCINPETRCIMPIYGIGDLTMFERLLGNNTSLRKELTSNDK